MTVPTLVIAAPFLVGWCIIWAWGFSKLWSRYVRRPLLCRILRNAPIGYHDITGEYVKTETGWEPVRWKK